MSKLKLTEKKEEYPLKNSPLALSFDAELRRLAVERDEPMADIIAKLARLSKVSERHIYNYREGKTDIPASLIPVFCQQFGSNALVMVLAANCEPLIADAPDELDLSRFASRTVRNVLACGDRFLAAFDGGKIDGHELNELKRATAASVTNFYRLQEIAETAYQRRRAA